MADTPRPPASRRERRRRLGSSAAFGILAAGGAGASFRLAPSVDVALAAAAAWIVLLLLVVAAWDLAAIIAGRDRYLAWLPELRLRGWLDPVRSSLVAIAFLYGIFLGHFFWR